MDNLFLKDSRVCIVPVFFRSGSEVTDRAVAQVSYFAVVVLGIIG